MALPSRRGSTRPSVRNRASCCETVGCLSESSSSSSPTDFSPSDRKQRIISRLSCAKAFRKSLARPAFPAIRSGSCGRLRSMTCKSTPAPFRGNDYSRSVVSAQWRRERRLLLGCSIFWQAIHQHRKLGPEAFWARIATTASDLTALVDEDEQGRQPLDLEKCDIGRNRLVQIDPAQRRPASFRRPGQNRRDLAVEGVAPWAAVAFDHGQFRRARGLYRDAEGEDQGEQRAQTYDETGHLGSERIEKLEYGKWPRGLPSARAGLAEPEGKQVVEGPQFDEHAVQQVVVFCRNRLGNSGQACIRAVDQPAKLRFAPRLSVGHLIALFEDSVVAAGGFRQSRFAHTRVEGRQFVHRLVRIADAVR